MIRDWLTPDKIKVINSIDSWENAVRLAAEPLLMQGYIAGSYRWSSPRLSCSRLPVK